MSAVASIAAIASPDATPGAPIALISTVRKTLYRLIDDGPVVGGHLAFHYHSQGHRSVPEDWRLFLDFAGRHFRGR